MSTTFELFSKDFSDRKIKEMNDTYDRQVEKGFSKPKHVIAEGRKRRAQAKIINKLRQEAIHEKGYDMKLILPLSADQLKDLINGTYKFNEYNEFVFAF
ncbi:MULTISPECIES: hypothetical protein [Enterobacter cloacae complex]|uniref:hypothetical protein n=1 Tax=Enterobacter cloacae complex TaxID=354276 RepID=UPI0013D3780F|nr:MULTISPECIES: hypothetical protein [Enterobacter cloacae complex]MBG0579365.1 hypothetical protein [Enterobacter kobei]